MQSWPLRFISESTDMVNLRSLMSRQSVDGTENGSTPPEIEEQEQNFFEAASPETKSEVSQWFDAQSEAPGSSSSSQLDPNEEGFQLTQNGSTGPPRKPAGLWTDWQTQFAQERDRRLAADEVVRELRQQREHMNAELFSIKTANTALKDENSSLHQQNHSLLEDFGRQTAQQEVEVFAARFTARLFASIVAEQDVAAQHQQQIQQLQSRYSRLHSMMSSMQEQQRQEELEERQRTSTWGYHLRQCSLYAGCVALGAGGILALIHVCEGREGLRALRPQS